MNPVRVILSAAAITLSIAAMSIVLVIAVDVFLLVFLGVLFAVFLNKCSTLIASYTPATYGWSLGCVVTMLMVGTAGSATFFGARIENQLNRADEKMDEAADDLRSKLQKRPKLKALIESVPFAGELLQQEGAVGSEPPADLSTSESEASIEEPMETEATSSTSALSQQTYSVAGRAFGVLGKIFATAFGLLTSAGVVFFVGVFVAADPSLYQGGVVRLFPKRLRERAAEIMDQLGETLWRWLLGRFLSMLMTGAGTATVLWLLGVPLPLTLGVVTGLLTFIPNIGGVIALALAVLLALPSGPLTAVWVVVLYLALQLVESNVITPLVQQRQVSVPPALLIAFQLLMAALTGFLGVMVATPLLAAGVVCVKRIYVEDILGDEPA